MATFLERIHLEIIQAVDRHGSLTAAAERLHLTQPALSHCIRKLEDQLGTPIWHREGRNLRPTQAGHYLLGVANRLLPQLQHAEERLRQFARGERGTLRIGMECHPCYQWLLKVVAPYLRAWPAVDVDVKQKFQFGGIGALFNDEIDLLVTPDPLYRPGLRYEAVFDYEQVLVVAQSHPLAHQVDVQPDHLPRRHRPPGHLHTVPDPRRHRAPPSPTDRDHRHHAADGGKRPRRDCPAPLAGRREHAALCRGAAAPGPPRRGQADLPGVPGGRG